MLLAFLGDSPLSLPPSPLPQDFKGLDDGRVSFIGEIKKVPEGEETTKAREMYLAKHPGHFWVDFGTFLFFN
jgi:hypothetical protein